MDDPPSYTIAILLSIFSGQVLIYALSFVIIVALLLISAFASATEAAFFSLKFDHLDAFKQSQNDRNLVVVELLGKPKLLLATISIINTLVNVGVITISAFVMWTVAGTRNPEGIIFGFVIILIAFSLIFLVEIIPKAYATKNNIGFARKTAKIWRVLLSVCKPISTPLLKMSNVIELQFEKKEYQTTITEELNQALELAVNTDASEDEKEILRGIVNFGTLTVRQIMKSRIDISAANADFNFTELMEYVRKSGFSRIPVFRNSIDKIEGVLYIKDLLPFLNQPENFNWKKLLRPGFFVPENKKIDLLLKDFQEKRVHMALVVNESGATSGLITLEDIIEEIIGDINDEFDEVGSLHQKN